MKVNKQLLDIEKIFEVQYEKNHKEFRKLTSQETRLRAEIAKLDSRHQASCDIGNAHFEMRSIGADVAWNAWVGRKKAQLNLELAQVLSVKDRHLKQVREAFGKLSVTRDLSQKMRLKHNKALREKALLQAIESSTRTHRS
jgi:alkylhydroperoxidase family enzyme